MIVFGGTGWRRDAYTRHLPSLQDACRRLRVEKVIDLGVPTVVRPALPVPFVEAGALPGREASELMRRSLGGFFTYPVPHIGKSTIFAAYCAHGLVPVTFPGNHLPGDQGLRAGRHFLEADGARWPDENGLAELAGAAHLWYQQHCLAVHASEIHADLPHARICG